MSKVRLFTTPSCPYCYTLREWLKGHQIEFEDVDVAKNVQARDEMIQRSGQIGAPVVEIDGEIIVGFDKAKICKLLNIQE